MIHHSQTNQPPSISALVCSTLLIFGFVSLTGCQFAPKSERKWPWQKEKKLEQPDRIMAVWTDSILHQTGLPGVRGFGGRVYFYGKDNTTPIEVDGVLAVYVFDAEDLSVSSQKPLRKFVFTAEQFKKHMSKTSIGPSYSVWLPWGEIGGPPMRLSLISRFEGADGGTTLSDPTIKLLPGIPVNEQPPETVDGFANRKPNNPYQLAGYQQPVADSDVDANANNHSSSEPIKPDRQVDTIDLPPAFQRYLRGVESAKTNQHNARGDFQSSVRSYPLHQPANELSSSSPSRVTPQPSNTPASANSALAPHTDSSDGSGSNAATQTTEVYDYRTRQSGRRPMFPNAGPAPDIRQGRWIEGVKR